ncbi:MAG: LPS export ABC transporter periplasmic protein LptC [Bryobacteraceae bacterium]
MRLSRWLILAAIFAIVVSVSATYIKRKASIAHDVPPSPPRLETGINGRANDWVYTQSDGDRPRVTVRAKSFKQVREPSVMELSGVELQLFHTDGKFDLVKSDKAEFDIAGKTLYSDGDVEIEMARPADGEDSARVVKIRSSGVRFASDTGKAVTDREATFQFDGGDGSALGAEYDPNARELHLKSNVSLAWRGKNAQAKPMHVQAGEAIYYEIESRVSLLQWSKFIRGSLRVEGGPAEVQLKNGAVQDIASQSATGVQEDAGRKIEFSADRLHLVFGEGMTVQTIRGENHGKLISTANGTRTTVNADRLDLDFAPAARESVLTKATASGKSVVEARPLPVPGELLADTRILRSDIVTLQMRTGGQEIEKVETQTPGTIEFQPNRPGQPKRTVQAERMWITYGPQNRIQTFLAANVNTRTERPVQTAPQLTQSKALLAVFDPKTSEMTQLDQTTDFRYEEGPRRATGNHAVLEQGKDLITLEGSARVWDPTGSTNADTIVLNQKNGDFTADGHVATTRQPDRKPTGMLSGSDVVQGRAQRMTATDGNQKIRYEGAAVVWQGPNRVEGDRIDIDRSKQTFEAHGKVTSQLADKSKDGKAKSTASVFTVVRAPDLVYTGAEKVAHYQGGVSMTRPGLTVTGKEMKAFLKEADGETTLDKALTDGSVKIVSNAEKRTRVGTSEHAEYYAGEEKVILEGGDPLFVDSVKGQTRGKQLTWFSNSDRLLVNGAESRPANTLLRKK